MSERSKRQRVPVAVVFIAVLLDMFSVFNLLDWLMLDWLIVVTIRPGFLILPGTESLAGYN